jgi:tetratricopeptide (TPR) repeat protein
VAFASYLCAATSAFASAIDDGNAGLDALNSGDFTKAISLFTRALKSGELKGDDREFAYLNRGKAYLARGDNAKAVADLEEAVKLNPSDQDASAALQQAKSHSGEDRGTRMAHGSPAAQWGALSSLAGQYRWVSNGNDPHHTMMYCEWTQPLQIMLCTTRSKHEKVAVTEFKLDPANGELLEAIALTSGVYYGTVTATATSCTEYFYINNVPTRQISTYSGGSTSDEIQRFANGTWQDVSTSQEVQATDQEVQDSGYFKKKD